MAENMVEHWSEQTDGLLSEVNMRSRLEARGYRVSRYVYPPGTYFPTHCHQVDKIDGVISGKFRITMNGQAVVLFAGDMLIVPRGVQHSAEVIGDEAVISLDAIRHTC